MVSFIFLISDKQSEFVEFVKVNVGCCDKPAGSLENFICATYSINEVNGCYVVDNSEHQTQLIYEPTKC